jgi:tRNA A37 threonylcarbamoyladenosine dehydratase
MEDLQNNFMNQEGLYNPANQEADIIVCGVGASGSYTAFMLSKLGLKNITCIDFDNVENHNIPVQIYRKIDCNKPKVDALKEIIKDATGIEIIAINSKIDESFNFNLILTLNSIVILCFDNMEARKLVYNKIKDNVVKIIDERMGGEGFSIQVVDCSDDEDKSKYEASLNIEAKDLPCGENGIVYTIANLASEVCNIVKKIEMRQPYPKILKREMKTYRFIGDQDA